MIALIEIPDKVNQRLGNVTILSIDSRGNVMRWVDPLRNEPHTSFHIYNRPVAFTRFLTATGLGAVTPNAIPGTTAQELDHNGYLITVIYALGRRTKCIYVAPDRRWAIIYPDESQMVTDYDPDSKEI